MRQKIVRELKSLHAISVENPACPGTPDVNCVYGWIELKWLAQWPRWEQSKVRTGLRPEQRLWHIKRRLVGGYSWVLLQCKREWFLFDGGLAAVHLDTVPRRDLRPFAIGYWVGLNGEELKECLSQPLNSFSLTAEEQASLKQWRLQDLAFL